MVMVLVMSISMLMVAVIMISVPRNVLVVVPIIAYEVDRSATCVILPAMFVPVLLMSWRDVQVDRLSRNIFRRARDYDRLCKHDRRPRNVANINLAVEAWLADADRHAYVTGKSRDGAYTQQCGKQKFLHGIRSLYIDSGVMLAVTESLDRIERSSHWAVPPTKVRGAK